MGSSAECIKGCAETDAWGPLSGALRAVLRLTGGDAQPVAPEVVQTLTGGARLGAPKAVHWLTRGVRCRLLKRSQQGGVPGVGFNEPTLQDSCRGLILN